MRKICVFVVGHEDWGKSRTLRALTNGNTYQRRITINEEEFYIRRMSNDDQPDSYVLFMKSLDPSRYPYLIAALCPNFERKDAHTASILRTLKQKGYELFFWVIKHQYGTSEVVTADQLSQLRGFGRVEVFQEVVEASARSRHFREFVSNAVLR
jgi:hypothetical protein